MTKRTKAEMQEAQKQVHRNLVAGNPKAAAVLIKYGLDVNGTVDGEPALIAAVRGKCWENCAALLEAGANIDAQDKDGGTALRMTLYYGGIEFSKLLIEHGANVHVKDKYGYTPLHNAASNGAVEFCEILINSGAHVNERNGIDSTPLIIAADHGHADVCSLLIEYGANVHLQNRWGHSALYEAAWRGRLAACKVLVEHGASPSEVAVPTMQSTGGAKDNFTPFQEAVRSGHVDVVRYFVTECGEDLGQRTDVGRSLAQVAASKPQMRDLLRSLKTELGVRAAAGFEAGEGSVNRSSSLSIGVL